MATLALLSAGAVNQSFCQSGTVGAPISTCNSCKAGHGAWMTGAVRISSQNSMKRSSKFAESSVVCKASEKDTVAKASKFKLEATELLAELSEANDIKSTAEQQLDALSEELFVIASTYLDLLLGDEDANTLPSFSNPHNRESVQGWSKTPLLEAVKQCAEQDTASFHFPGHRRGLGAPFQMVEMVGASVFAHDLPELSELDNLFCPEGAIAEAQREAARLFGADATFFLINGSTCGIQASVMATCRPGDYLILPRNCHLSATSAMVLSGALPKYVLPAYDSRWGIAHGVCSQEIEKAIKQVQEDGGRVGAVLVVSPTYFGVCSSIDEIAEVCGRYGIALIVDEAHGAHFKFHPDLPLSALEQGADIAVQSTHKVLGSLTQSSMLHIKGQRVSHEAVAKCLQMVQSTSPSYLLLSSLDAARAQMREETLTSPQLKKALNLAMDARESLKAVTSLFVLDAEAVTLASGISHRLDPLRITVGLWGLSVDGYEADDILRLESGVISELPAIQTITFAVSMGTCERDIDRLVESLRSLASRFPKSHGICESGSHRNELLNSSKLPMPSRRALSPRDAFFCNKVTIDSSCSVGEVCAELICPYPPGIPVIAPGEVVTEDALVYLKDIARRGHCISGASDPLLSTIQICQL
ncbi:hypothetical protein R1sor_021143 [Riccia sorocarpa]|uniref:Orn/Lys/Arg decarboxylases family 1 pyridoxal-P attachment site domain-containing protein n=1 Tax=Riccia sorocarpa TaxID=122646 RepID=A0ABD3GJ47_9MARC